MRHPTFRILIALLMVACAPLCCCQASSWLGLVRGDSTAQPPIAAQSDADEAPCCKLCIARTPPKPKHHDNGQTPCESGCKVCPSCQGVAGGSGLAGHVKVPHFDATEVLPPPCMWVVVCRLIEPTDMLLIPPQDSGTSVHLRANRELLRWQCALIV
jgi:hypothetical protein